MSGWQNDPERFVKPDPFVEGHRVISDRDPGDENDADRCPGACAKCAAEYLDAKEEDAC